MQESPNQKSTDHKQLLHWTKDAFSLNYSIFENGQMVGTISDKSSNRSAKASLFGENYVFEGEGIIRPRVNIIDLTRKAEIGRINYALLRSRASIDLMGNRYEWKFVNFLYTKWSLSDLKGNVLISGEKRKEGVFRTQPEIHPSLFLSSLIIRNRYAKHGY
jgi:hypothetical protein